MASLEDGASHLSSTSLVERGVTSIVAGDGPTRKGTGTREVLNE
jgi:hypothetical protein